jgi:hypothetical protein
MNEIQGDDHLTEGDGQPGFDLPHEDEEPMSYTLTFNWDGDTHTLEVEGSKYPNKNAMINANLAKFLRSKGLEGTELNLNIWRIKNGGLKIRPTVG